EATLDALEPAAGELARFRPDLMGGVAAVEDVDEIEGSQGRLDGGDRGEAPLDDARAALEVARDQLAGLLRHVEHHRGRLGDHEPVVVDHWQLAERADPAVSLAVELAAGLVERVDSIRQAGLLESPLHPKVLGLATALGKDACNAIKSDHVILSIGCCARSGTRLPPAGKSCPS